ncbi:hypothetical protein RHGRI_013153 [Rhododendron griersonianum]|uniref:F-box domain-containing protein n=1 Tax=Rhododendron griersonianum TaxID=479676 RepID=A0AAV6K4V3_9ERIC|nr:hypothetical protein RHGRI_013153 [Rhododendron griersonianum]
MSQFGSLALETVVDILARLSITSLGRCRCVCKSWRSLIADPFFINKQLCVNHHGCAIDGDRNHYFFLAYSIFRRDRKNSSSRHEPYFYSSHSLHCSETFEECKRLQFPTDIGHSSIKISSCNGVLCLLRCHDLNNSYAIILWNPSINKFKILPKPGGQFEASSFDDVSVGIGFVPRTNDYKVVRLMSMMTRNNSDVFFSTQIEMYSLSTDSWTTWTGTYDVQWRLYVETTDASVNGAVHWTAMKTTWCDDDDNGSQLIVSFHLADKVLREICLPNCHCGRPNRNYGFISVIYEKLAFTIDRGDEDLFYQKVWEIWLLEDYNNNRESWTRFRTITMGPTCRDMVPVQFLNNGEFVVCSGMGRLIVFDPKTQQIVAKELRGSGFIVVNYTQSLVLVNEGTDAPSTEMSSFAKELKELVLDLVPRRKWREKSLEEMERVSNEAQEEIERPELEGQQEEVERNVSYCQMAGQELQRSEFFGTKKQPSWTDHTGHRPTGTETILAKEKLRGDSMASLRCHVKLWAREPRQTPESYSDRPKRPRRPKTRPSVTLDLPLTAQNNQTSAVTKTPNTVNTAAAVGKLHNTTEPAADHNPQNLPTHQNLTKIISPTTQTAGPAGNPDQHRPNMGGPRSENTRLETAGKRKRRPKEGKKPQPNRTPYYLAVDSEQDRTGAAVWNNGLWATTTRRMKPPNEGATPGQATNESQLCARKASGGRPRGEEGGEKRTRKGGGGEGEAEASLDGGG